MTAGVRSVAERLDLLAELGDVPELDVLVAADDVGQRGERDGLVIRGRRQVVQRLLDERAVLADELALDPADLRTPEDVEGAAAQTAHRVEQLERAVEPRPE